MTDATISEIGRFNALAETAVVVEQSRDWEGLLRIGAELKALRPDRDTGYLTEARALRNLGRSDAAEAVLEVACARFPQNLGVLSESAWTAMSRRDWPEALSRWEIIQARFPDKQVGYFGYCHALRASQQIEAANQALDRATERFPNNLQLRMEHALAAEDRNDWPTAQQRWEYVVQRHPDDVRGHLGRIRALQEQRRPDEAETLLADALTRYPTHPGLLTEHAQAASRRRDWPEAVRRWTLVRDQKPDALEPTIELGQAMINVRMLDEAEAFLAEATARFPRDPELAIQRADCANRRRDWAEARARWIEARDRFPTNERILAGLAETLMAQRDHAAAKSVLDDLLARDPHNVIGAILHARLDMREGRFGGAADRLTLAAERYPSDRIIGEALNDARLAALLEGVAANVIPQEDAMVALSTSQLKARDYMSMRQMLLHFESMGNNCEFGLLQRKFGAEPLGLLRWAAIAPTDLSKMLESRFADIGDMAHTKLVVVHGNYILFNTRYNLGTGTFISVSAESAENILPKLCNRMDFLARKLSQSLRAGDKIFLYKALDPITDAETERLWGAVRSYGDSTLLVVRRAEPGHPSASLEHVKDGLMFGYIDRFSNTDISVDAWLDVCSAAYAAWQERKAA